MKKCYNYCKKRNILFLWYHQTTRIIFHPKKEPLLSNNGLDDFLRDNKHIINSIGFDEWLKIITENYEEWTSIEHLAKYSPSKIYLLDDGEYISDIVQKIYNDVRSL